MLFFWGGRPAEAVVVINVATKNYPWSSSVQVIAGVADSFDSRDISFGIAATKDRPAQVLPET